MSIAMLFLLIAFRFFAGSTTPRSSFVNRPIAEKAVGRCRRYNCPRCGRAERSACSQGAELDYDGAGAGQETGYESTISGHSSGAKQRPSRHLLRRKVRRFARWGPAPRPMAGA